MWALFVATTPEATLKTKALWKAKSMESQKCINPVIMDIRNWIVDIHNCKPITNKAAIMDIP